VDTTTSTTLGTGTLNAGTATFPATFATAEAHSLTATYNGDNTYEGSTSAAVSITIQ
jgi:hypothetical protein